MVLLIIKRRYEMTRQEAIEFIKASEDTGFRYGDLTYITEKQDAIQDIENMDDELWGDGEVYENRELMKEAWNNGEA